MKSLLLLTFTVLLGSSLQGQETETLPAPNTATSERLASQREALARLRPGIERLKSDHSKASVMKLAEILRKTDRTHIFQVEERVEIHQLAKEALLGIPGHAAYISEHLKASKAKAQDGSQSAHPLPIERSIVFETLKHLPSAEAVKALGDFLDDNTDELPAGYIAEDHAVLSANRKLAAKALANLIANPPVQREPRMYRSEDVETWKLWYAQVKAGTREFQFKGDDKVYRLSGPHNEAVVTLTPTPAPGAVSLEQTPLAPEVARKPVSFAISLVLSLGVLGGAVAWLVVSKSRVKR